MTRSAVECRRCRAGRLGGLAGTLAAVMAAMAVVLVAPAGAVPLPPTSAPLPGSAFQGADGDQASAPPLIDWATLVADARVAHSPDPNPDDAFSGGSSELAPDNWGFVHDAGGVSPAKSNILDAWSSVEQVAQPGSATSTFLYLAFSREAGASSAAFLTFELNRDARLWQNSKGAFIPCRRDGDLLITFVPEGNALTLFAQTWRTSTTGTFGCAATGTLSNAVNVTPNVDVQGAFNLAGPIANPLGGSAGATIPQFAFGETALDLGRVLSIAIGTTCGAFSSFWMHSRSSPAVDSALQDFVAPRAINARRCSASGTKYLDSNANGRRDGGERGLPGWRIYADLNDDGRYETGEPFAITDDRGDYTIDDITASGTYTLREQPTSAVPLDGPWTCSDPAPCEHVVDAAAEPDARDRDFGNWTPALVTLTKRLSPSNDPGRFDLALSASPTTVIPGAGDGTSRTFAVTPGASYTVSETAAEGTNAADYDSSVECTPVTRLGRLLPGKSTPTGVVLAAEHVECTFVNTRRGSPAVRLRKFLVAPRPAFNGDTLRFLLAVTNTSSGSHAFPADDVNVTDTRCTPRLILRLDGTGARDPSPGSLDPRDTWVYSCRVPTADVDAATCEPTTLRNRAHVTVAPAVSDRDRTRTLLHCRIPLRPDIAIQKVGPESAPAGSALTYVFYVRNVGELPFDEATVSVSDPACDAAPALVRRFDEAGNPDTSPAVLSPGDVWVFTCTNTTPAPGPACQPSTLTNTAAVLATADGRPAVEHSDDFNTSLTCAPTPPGPQPQPEAPGAAPPETPTVVPPASGVAGEADVSRVRGCLRRGSRVVIVGSRIADVIVTVGGRRIGGLRVTTLQRRAIVRIVGSLAPGRHRATATVRFERGAGTPTVRITRTVSVCAVQARPGFTG